MKKTGYICAIFLLSFALAFSGCVRSEPDEPAEPSAGTDSRITQAELVKLPSPPVCKQTSDPQEIQTLVDFLEGAEKTPRAPAEENGWVYQITLSTPEGTRQYAALGNILRIDGVSYQVSDTFLKDLEAIYQDIGAQEERF